MNKMDVLKGLKAGLTEEAYLKFLQLETASGIVFEFKYTETYNGALCLIFGNTSKQQYTRIRFTSISNFIKDLELKPLTDFTFGRYKKLYLSYNDNIAKAEALEKAREEKARQKALKEEQQAREEEQRKQDYYNFVKSFKTNAEAVTHGNMDQLTFIWRDMLDGADGLKPIKEIIYLFNNIDDERCLNELKSRLHADNKTSKTIFSHVSGVQLPKTNKDTYVMLDLIASGEVDGLTTVKPYKSKSEQTKTQKEETDKYSNVFYKFINNDKIEACTGCKIENAGYTFYISKMNNGGYSLTEESTGLLVFTDKTLKGLKDQLKTSVERIINALNTPANQRIKARKSELVQQLNN